MNDPNNLDGRRAKDAPPRRISFGWLLGLKPVRRVIIDLFHILYYGSDRLPSGWGNVSWLGQPVMKCPFDLWVYQEILYRLRPDVIVESGTAYGGSALFLAGICDLLGKGRILSIDVQPRPGLPEHPRLRYLIGSSTAPAILEQVADSIEPHERVMVVLDSCHQKHHVLEELRLYSQFVSLDSYLIVEDTNINGHPVWRGFGAGPYEAVQEFLTQDRRFVVDPDWEKYWLTFNPGGYLKRVR
jgi:cephalosporin hydroxylase